MADARKVMFCAGAEDHRMTVQQAISRARCTELDGDLRVHLLGFKNAAMRLADEVERLQAIVVK